MLCTETARQKIIEALCQDKVLQCAGQSTCFDKKGCLNDLFLKGFKGFENMSNQELIDFAVVSGLENFLKPQIDLLNLDET